MIGMSGSSIGLVSDTDRQQGRFATMPKTPGSKNYKNRPPGSRPPHTVSTLLSPLELAAVNKLADMQEITRSDVLRQALESYSRDALTFEEYREFYPVKGPEPPAIALQHLSDCQCGHSLAAHGPLRGKYRTRITCCTVGCYCRHYRPKPEFDDVCQSGDHSND